MAIFLKVNASHTPWPDVKAETDAELMALVKEGNMQAFGRLYQRYGGLVNHAVLSAAPALSRSDTEDMCQDIFLGIRKSAARYREEGKLRSWIYSYAVQTARERHRKQANRRRLLGLVHKLRPGHSKMEQPMPDVGVMVRHDMGALLAKLPEVQRQVLVLFERDGLKGEEIAQLLEMNINTVWTQLRRARETLNALVHQHTPGGGTT